MTTSEANVKLPSARMWGAIRTLARKFNEAVAEEVSLIKARNKQKKDLEELGTDPSVVLKDEWRGAASDLKLTEMVLAKARVSKDYFAEKLPEAIAFSAAGREYADNEMEALDRPQAPEDAPLFEAAMKAANLPDEPKPGEPYRGEAPLARVGTNENEADHATTSEPEPEPDRSNDVTNPPWASERIEALKMISDEAKKALADANLLTIGDLHQYMTIQGKGLAGVKGMVKRDYRPLSQHLNALPGFAPETFAPATKVVRGGKGSRKPAGRKPRARAESAA